MRLSSIQLDMFQFDSIDEGQYHSEKVSINSFIKLEAAQIM